MAEEENNEIQEETAAADVTEEAPVADAPADAPADASASEEAPDAATSEDAGTDEAGETEAAAATEAAPAEPAEAAQAEPAAPQLSPKERKVAIKTRKAAKVGTRTERSPEERQAERDAIRAKKAAERRAGRASARAKYKAAEHERTATPAREHVVGIQKTRQGVVVSDKADKTITVRIDVARRHRKYQKIVRTSNTLHAHDETNDAHIGDTVVVREARPLSRLKRWRLVEVVERAK
jgi:small subunit ribosomal protein S17